MAKRNLKFYSELVIVTVLSLIAANAWIILMGNTLNRYFPGNLRLDFLVAVIMTIVAIISLHFIFSNENNKKDENESYGPYHSSKGKLEVRHSCYRNK